MNLADIFPVEDYRFSMRFWRGEPADFFKPTAGHAQLIGERQQWLRTEPQRHAVLLPEGEALLEETLELARSWQTLDAATEAALAQTSNSFERECLLGGAWEPDFLLLSPGADGQFSLRAGCVCFPSSWDVTEKIGHPLSFIHEAVPGLNDALSKQIHGFLGKLKPGVAWQRANWGLSRSPELNQHPARKLRKLDDTVTEGEVFVRVEEQALVALPRNNGVLFGIRILSIPLREFRQDANLGAGLRRALESMPEDMARYKSIASARGRILGFLNSNGG